MIFLGFVYLVICLFFIFGFSADGKTAYALVAMFALIAPFVAAWRNSLKKEPSKMVCPNCGSGDVKITSRVEGVSGLSSSQFNRSYAAPNHHATINRVHNTRINRQRVAVCQSCGFDYPYITDEEVKREQKGAKGWMIAVVVCVLLCASCGRSVFSSTTERATPQSVAGIVATDSPATPVPVSSVKPGVGGNPLDDFSFSLNEDGVSLESYLGKAKRLIIENSYRYGDTEYKTDISGFRLGSSTVESLILSEGITEVNTTVFNCSDVKSIFFPSSMTRIYDYTLSYLHPANGERIKVFYAGTQDQWSQIFTVYQRKAIGDAELGEELGTALADAVNNWIGVEYDSSSFEYYFSATPEMVP